MTRDPLTAINTRTTEQSVQADPSEVKNNAGGFVFAVTPETRLRRFLTLGTQGGTFYVSEQALTRDNHTTVVLDFAQHRTAYLVDEILTISEAGRAPKQNPGIFALAAAAAFGDEEGRRLALDAIPRVCRTGTTLFQFVTYSQQFRGWGRGLRRGVGRWYTGRDADSLGYQLAKYRQRDGWTHRDVLRKAHPRSTDDGVDAVLGWAVKRDGSITPVVPILVAYEDAQRATTVAEWVEIIHRGAGLSWEMLPDAALNERAVWEALIDHGLPQTALLRQLPRLTRIGVFNPGSIYTTKVIEQLTSLQHLVKARVHPVNVLIALRTYASGMSARGSSTWTPNPQIVDALDRAFYAAFGAVPVTGKRHLLALDVSGSMMAPIGGLSISAREASAAIALVTAAIEPNTTIVGFTGASGGGYSYRNGRFERADVNTALRGPIDVLAISPRQRLDDAIAYIDSLGFGSTDCALPAIWARQNGYDFDAIVTMTDSETWAGQHGHPYQALTAYRQHVGHDVKQIVVGMAATEFSIADPRDNSSLDVAGFDAGVPTMISEFVTGNI